MDMTPVVYRHPFTGDVTTMPTAMINAFVPYAEHLHLEDAARLACARDVEAADNLILSIKLAEYQPQPLPIFSEGSQLDLLTIQPPM